MINQKLSLSKLVQVKNNQPVTSSRIVAKVFGKRHSDVMKRITNLIKGLRKSSYTPPMFIKSTIINPENNQSYYCYYMNFDGFNLLVMGFTGKKALKYKLAFIHAFDYMHKEIENKRYVLPQNYSTALRQLADEVDRNSRLLPKAKNYDKWDSNKGLVPVSKIAKSYFGKYHMSGRRLNALLAGFGIQYKRGKTWNLYQQYTGKGYANYYKVPINHNKMRTSNLEWYEKGVKFICKVMFKHGYKPEYRNKHNQKRLNK